MALYRLPFVDDSLWALGTGNWDDPKGGHGPAQAYAFDFTHPCGGTILAARAGTVIAFENDVSINTWNDLPDDPNVQKYGAGNYVLIRHEDNTIAAYDHLKKGSIVVKKSQWVPQGFPIALSGNTGQSSAPHCHFEVRAYWNSDSDLGASILIHFENQILTSWRPRDQDVLASNNSQDTPRQDGWRWCYKCQGLYFGGNSGSVCPKDKASHEPSSSGNYALAVGKGVGKASWAWCRKCQGLFFTGGNTPSHCPATGGAHDGSASNNYILPSAQQNLTGQDNWRWCHKCQGLFYAGNSESVCPAGPGGHDATGSGNYRLSVAWLDDIQFNWRRCAKCQGLFYHANSGSVCPAGPGGHDATGSGNYAMVEHSPDAPGETGFRWCHKCQGMFKQDGLPSVCPQGHAPHEATGSGDYTIVVQPHPLAQSDWQWCKKCGGLFFSDNAATSVCPLDKHPHDGSKSGNYALVHDWTGPGTVSGWKWCNKCQGLFQSDQVAQSVCPKDNGKHDGSSSGNYALANAVGSPGQSGWLACKNCQGLFYSSPNAATASVCPRGQMPHDGTGSSNFILDSVVPPGETNWHVCKNCRALFFANGGPTSCPAGPSHDPGASGFYALLVSAK